MTDRVVVHHGVLLAILRGRSTEEVGAPGTEGAAATDARATHDAAAARAAFAAWVEAGTELVVAAASWTAILDALAADGWTAAEMAEAIHALDGLDLATVETDRAAHLLAADAMTRHGLAAGDAACIVAGDLLDAPVAALQPAVVVAASRGIDVGASGATVGGRTASPRPSGLPNYRGLGAFLGELRRRETTG